MAPGTKAHLEVNREGHTETFDVQLAEMPPSAANEDTESSFEGTAQPEKTTVFGGVGGTNITGKSAPHLIFQRRFKVR